MVYFLLLKQLQVRLSLSHTFLPLSPCTCRLSARAFHTPTGLGPLSSMTLHDGWALGPSNQPHHRRGLCALLVSPAAPHSECQPPAPPHPLHTLSSRPPESHSAGRPEEVMPRAGHLWGVDICLLSQKHTVALTWSGFCSFRFSSFRFSELLE